jgi:uncharacterized membrane protein
MSSKSAIGGGNDAGGADGPPAAGHFRGPTWALARSGHLEYERVLFFTDAVFAIAITLLVIDLPVQVERSSAGGVAISAYTELKNAVPEIAGFGVSFVVIALFWIGHHSLFRFVVAFDRPLILLNLLFIGTIAFLPFPTELLSSVSANQTAAVVFYAACAGTAGLVELVAWLYARHADLVGDIDRATWRLTLLRTARIPVVFALSIPIAVLSPRAGAYFWVATFVSGGLVNYFYGGRAAGEAAQAAPTATEPDAGPE